MQEIIFSLLISLLIFSASFAEEIAEYLQSGKNTIASEVKSFGQKWKYEPSPWFGAFKPE